MTHETMHLTVTTDDRYLPHAATLLRSVATAMPDRDICVHLLHGEGTLATQELDRFVGWLERIGLDSRPLAVPRSWANELPGHKFHVSAWYRVLTPDLLPDVRRLLHLDADAVVVGDLTPLWEDDLEGAPFGAAVSAMYPFIVHHAERHLGLSGPGDYLNSGVLLLDLEAMRADDSVSRIRRYASAHPDNLWPEQDALAVLYAGRWRRLASRWNVQTPLYEVPPRRLNLPAEEIEQALEDPAVIHFLGPFKPWSYTCTHPERERYLHHRAQTPFGPAQLDDRSLRNRLLRRLGATNRARFLIAESSVREARRAVGRRRRAVAD